MWLKITKAFLAFGFFAMLIFISGCIEEPTIDPVKRPFSVARLGNFIYNVDAINVKIINPDGTIITKSNLQKNSFTDYFDVPSGKRKTIITNAANTDTILNKEIEFISYEEGSVLFTGFFSKDELLNTFAFITYPEGDILVEEKPKANEAWLDFIHISGDSPTDTNKAIIIKVAMKNATSTSKDTTTLFSSYTKSSFSFNTLTFGNYKSTVDTAWRRYRDKIELSGAINLSFINVKSLKDTLVQHNTNIEKGYRYFFFVTGEPKKDAMAIFETKQLPLPVRSK